MISCLLPPETIALVESTAPKVQERRAAITFRAWHHLENEAARRLLFEQYALDGRVLDLLDAIVAALRKDRAAGAALVALIPRRDDRETFAAMLEAALMRALQEVLGAGAGVVEAWRQAYRHFMRQLVPARAG